MAVGRRSRFEPIRGSQSDRLPGEARVSRATGVWVALYVAFAQIRRALRIPKNPVSVLVQAERTHAVVLHRCNHRGVTEIEELARLDRNCQIARCLSARIAGSHCVGG